MLTLHSQEAGDALPGLEILRLENAIHFHDMAVPADIVVKRVDFADPPLTGREVTRADLTVDISGLVHRWTIDPFAERLILEMYQ